MSACKVEEMALVELGFRDTVNCAGAEFGGAEGEKE